MSCAERIYGHFVSEHHLFAEPSESLSICDSIYAIYHVYYVRTVSSTKTGISWPVIESDSHTHSHWMGSQETIEVFVHLRSNFSHFHGAKWSRFIHIWSWITFRTTNDLQGKPFLLVWHPKHTFFSSLLLFDDKCHKLFIHWPHNSVARRHMNNTWLSIHITRQ